GKEKRDLSRPRGRALKTQPDSAQLRPKKGVFFILHRSADDAPLTIVADELIQNRYPIMTRLFAYDATDGGTLFYQSIDPPFHSFFNHCFLVGGGSYPIFPSTFRSSRKKKKTSQPESKPFCSAFFTL